jgi:hypothetical protein
MTQDEILAMFREEAERTPTAPASEAILALAQLLADSRGRLSKENFETLMSIGAALYKQGKSEFTARADIASIMQQSRRTE